MSDILKHNFHHYKIHIFVCLLIMASMHLSAQVFYSTDPNYILSKPEGNNLLQQYHSNYPDTSLNNFHQPFAINFMGNIGLPSPNFILKHGTDQLGFRFYDLPYRNDVLKENQILYSKSSGPYVQVNGINGSKQLQAGKIVYTQTFANRLTVSFNFNRNLSQGFYLRQQTFTNNFSTSSHFTSKNKRFGFYLYALNNGNRSQENGGIKDGVLSKATININKQLMPVNLSAASRDNRQTKLMFNPWLKLNAKQDSVSKFNHFIQVKSELNFASFKYKDLNSGRDLYYKVFNFDTVSTNDSTNIKQYTNSLAYNLNHKQEKLNFSVGYKNEINRVWQKQDSVFLNHLVFSDFVFRNFNPTDTSINKGFEALSHFEYVAIGKNAGNYKIENNSVYYFNILKNNQLYFNFLAEKRNADFIFNTWRSNHFFWNNTFAAQEQAQAQLGFKLGNDFQIACLYQNIFKYLYFDEQAKPAQLKKTIDNFAATINYSHVFFKHLGLAFAHTYQSTSKAKYYRVPENISSAKVFYNAALFKQNLNLQIGTQVIVFQSFKALAYMPSTQVFYLQSQATTAALPFVDVFLNARIHPVSIFLKVENVLQGMVGNNYSFIPGYYQTDRAFRFGLSWMFFD